MALDALEAAKLLLTSCEGAHFNAWGPEGNAAGNCVWLSGQLLGRLRPTVALSPPDCRRRGHGRARAPGRQCTAHGLLHVSGHMLCGVWVSALSSREPAAGL